MRVVWRRPRALERPALLPRPAKANSQSSTGTVSFRSCQAGRGLRDRLPELRIVAEEDASTGRLEAPGQGKGPKRCVSVVKDPGKVVVIESVTKVTSIAA